MIQPRPPSLSVQGLQFAWSPRDQPWLHWFADFSPGLSVLVGGDGAGKTTRLRLLATALTPQAGQLVLKLAGMSDDVAANSADAPATTHAIAQADPSPVSIMAITAWPNPLAYRQRVFWCDPASEAHDAFGAEAYVEHHRRLHAGWRDDLFKDLLPDLGLEGHLRKPLLGLSMGMRRKLRLACALASGAQLTLMDDPLAALDRRSIDVVNDLLADCATATRRMFVCTAHEPPPDELGARVISIDR